MGIHIGNNNKIKNATIAENSKVVPKEQSKSFAERHPILTGVIIAIISGFILSLSFWEKIKTLIEGQGK